MARSAPAERTIGGTHTRKGAGTGAAAVSYRVASREGEIQAAQHLRVRVFCGEQGIDPEAELDGRDDDATHVVAVRGGDVVATCRLLFSGGECRLGRMAVAPGWRGTGLGRDLLAAAEAEARRRSAHAVVLHAQTRVEGFYRRCGYRSEGEGFLEEGIEHVRMSNDLRREGE